MGFIRSTLFLAFMWLSIPFATALFLLLYPVPYQYRSQIIAVWSKICLSVLTFFCGLKYEISGLENIPDKPCIIFCKHQSTWETMVLQLYFIPEVWILKRELLWVPFFGWTLATMKSIAIDRSSGKKALKQIAVQGTKRLEEGNWVVIFPEGTRTLPGAKPDYKIGGAMLASQSGFDVLPIAHNAGEFWPKGQYVKKAGTIKMVIGSVIKTENLKTKQINQRAEEWIEATVNDLYENDYK
ncbi:MAG: 1-acyl-sn-glycerol-3-phosphate acyltransferase [gamma proteobacterium symbiont of Taylorina sp.]|nr:1-acyl-sn-glycerol-3-phosphate acyltransferase [gamma proteobacterium symbiont of Taylorina sp.]